ncbi:MAG: hypothetical protein ACYC6C_05345 [Coriobacteriia bacterium]
MNIAVVQRDIRDDATVPEVRGADVVFSSDNLRPDAASALGEAAVLEGDRCFDPDEYERLRGREPAALVLHPGSESELQAAAVLELAVSLSSNLAGLVVVVEDTGGQPGESSHGGSAIVHAGEVLAEAEDGAQVLTAGVTLPLPRPVAHGSALEVPTILQQRLANHQGRHLKVDYPSDI